MTQFFIFARMLHCNDARNRHSIYRLAAPPRSRAGARFAHGLDRSRRQAPASRQIRRGAGTPLSRVGGQWRSAVFERAI